MVTNRKKCNKGYGCGNSCISRKRTCKSNVGQDGKKLVENFTQYLQRLEAEDKIAKTIDRANEQDSEAKRLIDETIDSVEEQRDREIGKAIDQARLERQRDEAIGRAIDNVNRGDQQVERAVSGVSLSTLRRRALEKNLIDEAAKRALEFKLENTDSQEELDETFLKELEKIKEEIDEAAKEAIAQITDEGQFKLDQIIPGGGGVIAVEFSDSNRKLRAEFDDDSPEVRVLDISSGRPSEYSVVDEEEFKDFLGSQKKQIKEVVNNSAFVRSIRKDDPQRYNKALEVVDKLDGKESKPDVKPNEPGKARRPENVKLRSTQPQAEEVINIGRRIAERFIDPEIIGRDTLENDRETFLKNLDNKKKDILDEIELRKQFLRRQFGDPNMDFSDNAAIKKLEEELIKYEPEGRTEFFDEYDKLLNDKAILNAKFQRGEIGQEELIIEVDKISQALFKFSLDNPLEIPELEGFENLRNSLLETASFGAEEALENVEFSNTIEPERLERIKKSLAEAAMITNQIPRKNFRMINDLRQPRAYADGSFSEADNWAILDISNEEGVAGTVHGTNNVSSQYYRENPTMYPRINVGQYEFADSTTTFHEFAHHVEFANRDIATMNLEWIKSNATGPATSMNELEKTDVYDSNEVGYPGPFISSYVSKIYPTSGAGDQTEVLSMGFQYFSNPDAMLNLYSQSPEHFFLTLGTLAILRGEA